MLGFWKKHTAKGKRKGLTNAVLRGASHEELIEESLGELISADGADRLGVWLESQATDGVPQETAFHGQVWDRDSQSVPREWQTISPQTVLPLIKLLSGLSVESIPPEKGAHPLVGPVAGLHSVLWVPVQHAGKLRGILMAGSLSSSRSPQKEMLQEVASKLSVALVLETERRLSTERHSDVAFCNHVLLGLEESENLEGLLRDIVQNCVSGREQRGGLGAKFAFLAESDRSKEQERERKFSVLHAAGENTSEQFAETEAVRELMARALATQRTMGHEVSLVSGGGPSLRSIVVPIARKGEPKFVLAAGFPAGSASLAAIERMELRGKLATSVLREMQEQKFQKLTLERERTILETNQTPVVVLDSSGRVSASNSEARILLLHAAPGGNSEAVSGEFGPFKNKAFVEFFLVRDQEKVRGWLQSQGNIGGEGTLPDVELECGAGVRLRSQMLGEGRQAITLLASRPIATVEEERVRAELLGLSEWLDQGVILFDAEENVRLMNLRFAQLVGLAPEEVEKQKTLSGLVGRIQGQSAEPGAFAKQWKDLARRSDGGERDEIHLLRPTARVLERASRPILDLAGRKLGRIELYRDLTAQRMFQAKLLQTERMAALGQMVSGVAHELSNPLTSILGYAQRLLLRSDSADHFEEIRKIFEEAERAGAILRRMLLAARESAPERKPVPLNSIVQRTIELQRFSLAAERIRIDLQLEQDLPQVLGDAGQLQQVLMNLLGNARQAIESQGQGGTIRVRTRMTEDSRVRLEVTDSGPGIPESILPRIFDPFFTTKPAGVGTGLGLAIVLSLVREHGGQVHVASPRGGGAEFIVELPAAGQRELRSAFHPPQEVAAGDGQPVRRFRQTGNAGMPPRVLIVEDEPTVAQLIADVLRDEGFETEVHLDGRDAAKRAANEPFDLIVCDMKMPNLDGQNLYESLQKTGKAARRFLFVTGDVLGAKTHEFLSKHHLPHVAKPFRVDELLEKVHQVLQPAGGAGLRRITAVRKNSATTG